MKGEIKIKNKIILIIIIALCLSIFYACKATEGPKLTTIDIYNKFKDAGLPVGIYVEYTPDTDPNGLLGKTGYYIAKLNFEIFTLDQLSDGNPIGGSIEIFSNAKYAKKRKEYIDGLGMSFQMVVENSYIVNDIYFIRIDRQIPPSEAAKYADVITSK